MANPLPRVALLSLAVLGLGPGKEPGRGLLVREEPFVVAQPSEVVAVLSAGCRGCSWEKQGQEGAVLELWLDGRYSQHLFLTRGEAADYHVALGPLKAGPHRLGVFVDSAGTPPAARQIAVTRVHALPVPEGAREYTALSFAPILYARSNTIGRFTDAPLLMWYESEPTRRGTLLRYSVIFSNEDGGTPADRLMATWGRVTDIEYVYSVEIDAKGKVLAEEYQGPEHKLLAFAGRHEGRHPLEWVVTDNNMVSDKGTTEQRYALAPLFFDLENRSREAVMDANPWTYKVSDEEAQREGRIDESARPGGGKLPDPRRFLYLEACADLSDATLAFDVGLEETGGEIQWLPSDGGLEKFRIARAGCFQGAVAVPVDARGSVRAVRFRTYTRPAREGEAPLPKGTGKGRLLRVNRLFRLGPDHVPGEDLFRWAGDAALTPDGEPLVLPVNGQGQ